MDNHEKRSDLRLALECIVCFLEVQTSFGDNSKAKELICGISDISANGIRIDLDQELHTGALHKVRIQLPEENSAFHLVGEVAWSRTSDEFGPQAGILLIESDDTDIAEWKKRIAYLMDDPD